MHPPSAFGNFRVLHQIGSGVLGPVFRSYDSQRERLAAIKAFKVDLLPEQLTEFAEALRPLATQPFEDSGIVRAIETGVEGQTPFLALEFVSGDTLDTVLRESRPLTGEQILVVCGAIGRTIDAAWDLGVGHGSLHPRDVFLTDSGEVAVTGFGIAQALMTVGLPAPTRRPYTAPERDAGNAWDRRADVYSLAAIARVLLGTTITPSVASVVAEGLADDPAARMSSAGEFVDALANAIAAVPDSHTSSGGASGPTGPTVTDVGPSDIEIDRNRDVVWESDQIGDAPLRPLAAPSPIPDPVRALEIVDASSIGVTMRERPPVIAPRFPWAALIAASLACLAAGGLIGFRIGFSRASDARIVSELATVTAPTPAPVNDPVTREQEAPPRSVEVPPAQPQVETPTVAQASQAASVSSRRNAAASKASAGSIEVDSRPRGARVVVDGRAVGQTPLKVTAMSPGDHRVLIELTGHRRVASTVKVVAGEQARLAVSLEQTGSGADAPRKRN